MKHYNKINKMKMTNKIRKFLKKNQINIFINKKINKQFFKKFQIEKIYQNLNKITKKMLKKYY